MTTISSPLTISSGQTSTGIEVVSNTSLTVDRGGTSINTTLTNGVEDIYGIASNTTVNSGSVYLGWVNNSGGTSFNTILAGFATSEVVEQAETTGTIIRGQSASEILRWGGAVSTTVSSGGTLDLDVFHDDYFNVDYPSVSLDTVVESGGQEILTYGNATSTTINSGGKQEVLVDNGDPGQNIASNAVINGGQQDVYNSAINTTINSGGVQNVYVYGFAVGTQIFNAGIENVSGVVAGTSINGGTQEVFSGGVADNTTVSGIFGLQFVSSGGTTVGTVIIGGGVEQLYGIASGSVVNGGSLNVSSGGLVIGTIVGGGGALYISTGGIASNTTVGGLAGVFAGGNMTTATIGGEAIVYSGAAIAGAAISGGLLEIRAGASVSGAIAFTGPYGTYGTLKIDSATMPANVISGLAVGDILDLAGVAFAPGGSAQLKPGNLLQVTENANNYSLHLDPAQNLAGSQYYVTADVVGGTEVVEVEYFTVSAGQNEADITLTPGTVEQVYGSTLGDTVLQLAWQNVSSGGVASNTTVGGGGVLNVYSGGATTGALIYGGGQENVFFSGMATGTTVSSGLEVISSGGTAVGTLVRAFGGPIPVSYEGLIVSSGGTASATVVSSGNEIVAGYASGTVVSNHGYQYIAGLASATAVDAGGSASVENGGTMSGAVVNAGGELGVGGGGTAIGTTLSSGGVEDLYLSGSAVATTILGGGRQNVGLEATASGSIVFGTEVVGAGTTINPTIMSGGIEIVSGSVSGAVIAGGVLELEGGAAAQGSITFSGAGGTLKVDGTTMPGNVISGLGIGDTIDLAGVSYSGGTVALSGANVLQVTENGHTYSLQLDPAQNLSGQVFRLFDHGQGGTAVLIPRLVNTPTTVSSGQVVAFVVVGSGGSLTVRSGGIVNGAVISSGG
jgi:autotransporter passenger strand-loop-strand repeat protein